MATPFTNLRKMILRKICLTALLPSILSGCSGHKTVPYDIVIENANSIDIVTGEITTNQAVFITDGTIVRMETSVKDRDYAANTVIDATGKYLLPGFWDNHIHFRGGEDLIEENKSLLPLFIANGITTVRDAGGDLSPSIFKWKEQIASGELAGPTIFTPGPKLDGPDAAWAGSLVVENKQDVIKALDSLQALDVDFVKIYDSSISKEAYLEILKRATDRGMVSSGHMPFTVELTEAIDAGIGAVEHLYYVLKGCSRQEGEITEAIIGGDLGFWDAMPRLIATYDAEAAQKTFTELKENNTYVVPTLHIGHVLSYLDEENHESDEYLKYMGGGIIKTYEGRIKSALNASKEARASRKQLNSFFQQLTKSLHDAGVDLLAGSDCGAYNAYVYPGISLHKELAAMVAAGLSPLAALQTSAYNGSKFLNKNDAYGSIDVGKISDLVLLDRNPLEDIDNTTSINTVIKGDQVFGREDLDELLKR